MSEPDGGSPKGFSLFEFLNKSGPSVLYPAAAIEFVDPAPIDSIYKKKLLDKLSQDKVLTAGHYALDQDKVMENINSLSAGTHAPAPETVDWAKTVIEYTSNDIALSHHFYEMLVGMQKEDEQRRLENELSYAASQLPGATETASCPGCDKMVNMNGESPTPVKMPLLAVIVHLNDNHKWSREEIADWLDELADKGEIDIDFPTPE